MKLVISIAAFFLATFSYGQIGTISGTITDNSDGGQPMIGVKVEIKPSETPLRARTDDEGNFTIGSVPYGDYTLVVSGIDMDSIIQDLKVDKARITANIESGNTLEQDEVEVIGNLVKDRKTPVAVSTIGTREITEELGSQDLPMILNSKPGVHATQQGGGDGDARITIRGFDQRNVGVMIDGVPVNDMENGWVYWSNWFGLDAITSQIQVQRGLGATKLAMPSVGGTMNIITMSTGGKRKIKVKQEYGSGNFLRTSVAYKSGTLKNGWGVLFAGSYKQGNGWVDGLNTQGGFYYLKVQKRYKTHILSLSAFGAPQQHGQRSYSQPIEYWDSEYASSLGIHDTLIDAVRDNGIRFNQHWGYRTIDGEKTIQNERRNYFHKPQVTLKDFWKVNKKLSWSNIAYLSIGRGGGQRYFNSGGSILYDQDGQIDWDTIIHANQWFESFGFSIPNVDLAYDSTQIKSNQILSASVNNHFWVGGLSQFDYKLNKKWNLAGGIDYRYYKGTHFNEVLDLLGGDYFANSQNQNAESPMKVVGDKIGRQPWHNYRDGFVQWAGGFAQAEYSHGRWTGFVNASTVTNFYKGVDYFEGRQLALSDTTLQIGYNDTITHNGQTYDRNSAGLVDHTTGWTRKTGFTFKTGLNMSITEKQNVFLNVGYLSRTPQFSNVVNTSGNEFFDTIVNEKILAFEIGYGFTSKKFSLNFNSYYTKWENRPFPFGLALDDPNDPGGDKIIVNLAGIDALHYGAEVDMVYKLNKNLSIEGMVSLGDWTWQSAEEILVDGVLDTIDVRGIHVGNAAQSSYAASVRYGFLKRGYVKVKYTYFDRYYSNFNVKDYKTGSNTVGVDPWRIPSYGLLSFHAGYGVIFEKSRLNFKVNVFNVLNSLYISDASNNWLDNDFDANSATVFIGQGTRFNVSLGFEF
ncbi:MAG: iron complex outermembrane receptor protein [Flavobacteriaceae bacterium]|jgi:iron complex outermembrane receptor protein